MRVVHEHHVLVLIIAARCRLLLFRAVHVRVSRVTGFHVFQVFELPQDLIQQANRENDVNCWCAMIEVAKES